MGLIRTLSTLVELERGLRAACDAAAERLAGDPRAGAIRALCVRIDAAVARLSLRIAALGGVAPDARSSRPLIGASDDLIRSLPSTAHVCAALAAAADEVDGAYARALDDTYTPQDMRIVLRALRAKLVADRAAFEDLAHPRVTARVASS